MDNKRIGNFIRELREKEGLSQNALAKKVYVASTVVSRWESGKAGVSANNLVLLSEIFHVSLDELVAGHRFDEDNKKEKNEVLIDVLNSHQSKSRYIKRLLHLVLVLLIIFLGYFFYNFYNSVKVYTIHMDSDKYNITYGMLTKTRDRIYFHLDIDSSVNNDDIEHITIYYKIADGRKDILKSNTITSFNFMDYYGYEEYISFNNFDKIINNMYFEVSYKDNNVENYKLTFDRNYANIDFFLKKSRNIEKSSSDGNKELTNSEHNDKVDEVRKILKDNDELTINYDGVDYEIYLLFNSIKIYYIEDNYKNNISYVCRDKVFFSFEKMLNNAWKTEYVKCIDNNQCVDGNCENYENHYKKFINILDFIIEENK